MHVWSRSARTVGCEPLQHPTAAGRHAYGIRALSCQGKSDSAPLAGWRLRSRPHQHPTSARAASRPPRSVRSSRPRSGLAELGLKARGQHRSHWHRNCTPADTGLQAVDCVPPAEGARGSPRGSSVPRSRWSASRDRVVRGPSPRLSPRPSPRPSPRRRSRRPVSPARCVAPLQTAGAAASQPQIPGSPGRPGPAGLAASTSRCQRGRRAR